MALKIIWRRNGRCGNGSPVEKFETGSIQIGLQTIVGGRGGANGFAYIVVYVVVLMDETWVCLKASAKDMVKRKRLCI